MTLLNDDAVLHLTLPKQEQSTAAGEHRWSTRQQTVDEVGFVHGSYPHQVERTANPHYADVAELVVLEIDPDRCLDALLVVEVGTGEFTERFHLYGPVPVVAVVRTCAGSYATMVTTRGSCSDRWMSRRSTPDQTCRNPAHPARSRRSGSWRRTRRPGP